MENVVTSAVILAKCLFDRRHVSKAGVVTI